jgi:antitoxin component YwqK of YwqJK toxin-antitoxin module
MKPAARGAKQLAQWESGIKTAIPARAKEFVLKRYPGGLHKQTEYVIRGKVIGSRWWYFNGALEVEEQIERGKKHGLYREYHPNGILAHETCYVNGKEHGVSKQYDETGRLIGTYRMNHGTGIDSWYSSHNGRIHLSEERQTKDGKWHGFERWWWTGRKVWKESHFRENWEHGIFREWNNSGKLLRGFPKYYVNGKQTTKTEYLEASKYETSLPKFVEADNRPYRKPLRRTKS